MLSENDLAFLACLRDSLHPSDGDFSVIPEQIPEILKRASIHAVIPLVYDSLRRRFPDENTVLSPWKTKTMRIVFHQTVCTQNILHICSAFHAAGLRILIVKGLVCRNMYPNPDSRISNDEDLYIHPEDWDAMHRILTDAGLEILPHTGDDTVITYTNPQNGLRIEAHKQLFAGSSQVYGHFNEIFADSFNHARTLEIEGYSILTLNHTDHMLLLLLHSFKHFLHAGFGIRQVCDICLYACRYRDQIHWPYVEDILRQNHAAVFASAVWKIGCRYLGFTADDYISIDAPDPDDMLADLLNGGLYGSSTEDRLHSSMITLHAASADGNSAHGHVLHTIFPPLDAMQNKYTYAKKHPLLLPAAWCHRIFQYLCRHKHTSAGESIRIGRERVELLRRYGIIE